MYLDELLRCKIYFILDKFKGRVMIGKISKLEEFAKLKESRKIHVMEESWLKLCNDITENVPFYTKFKNITVFEQFPVINKRFIAKNPSEFYNRKYNLNQLVPVNTSGSYGTPLTYYLTKSKKKSQQSEVIFYGRKSGYDVGIRHGYFRTVSTKSKFKFWLQNETFFDSKKLNEDFLKSGLLKLIQKKVKFLIGFPSAISILAKYCLDQGFKAVDFNVKGVITQSENLTKYQREVIGKAFDCPVHNRYSTEEFGVLGNECDEKSGFEINCCNYIVEVLDLEKDKSVVVGEIGRVVVTDLQSNGMPLVRYETGDLAKVDCFIDDDKKWVSKLSTLSGRTIQIIFDTKDAPLYPLYFDEIMSNYNCFSQYQIIQDSKKEYTVKLVVNSNFMETHLDLNLFNRHFKECLGDDAKITVEFTDDIAMLISGKRPFIINRYKEFSL